MDIPSAAYQVPGPQRFSVRGQAFELDLLDAIYHLQDVAEQVRAAGGTHRDYLGHVIDLVRSASGVELTAGEADWLNDFLNLEHARAKKKRRDDLHATLGLPTSTESTPSD